MKRKTVCIIGHFGFGKDLLNGQTVKTKILAAEIKRALGEEQVMLADTHGGVKALLKLPFQTFRAMVRCDNVVILPAHRGLRIVTPLLSFWKLFFRRKLHYAVIGGWLASYIEDKPGLKRRLKKFTGIYVETVSMKNDLESQGFTNIHVMPNAKDLPQLKETDLVYPKSEPYKLCTFSRVMLQKGIEDAVEAVKAVNTAMGRTVFELDIYGQIDGNQTQWFEQLQADFPAYIRYGGLVPFDQSVSVLKKYFALLFPTYYEGEGFAGTLLDAFASGLPVVATDWKYNSEIVDNGVTGLVYPTGVPGELEKALLCILEDVEQWNGMKPACLKEAQKYRPEEVIKILLRYIGV